MDMYCYIVFPIPSEKTLKTSSHRKEDERDVPVKYSTSGAKDWHSVKTFATPKRVERPKYESLIVMLSMASFILYFAVFREENDVDEKFTRTIYEHVPALEEKDLIKTIKIEKQHGRTSAASEARLKQIQEK